MGVLVSVTVGVCVSVEVSVQVGVAVSVTDSVAVRVWVGVCVSVTVGVLVSVTVGVQVSVEVSVQVGVAVSVTDNGIGIHEKNLEYLFEPFYTTKEGKGTGLGLSITYGIVQKLGGQISVESKVGEGTCVTVLLPTTKKG